MGRVLNETQCVLTVCNTIPYTYDYAGNMRTQGVGNTGNSLSQITYGVDSANRINSVSSNWSDAAHPSYLYQATNFDVFGVTAANLAVSSAIPSGTIQLLRSHNIRSWPLGDTYAGAAISQPATPGSAQIAFSKNSNTGGSSTAYVVTINLATGLTSMADSGGVQLFANTGATPAGVTYTTSDTPTTVAQEFVAAIGSICVQPTLSNPISEYVSAQFQAPNQIILTQCPNSPLPLIPAIYYPYYEPNPSLQFAVNALSQNTITVELAPGLTSIPDSGDLLLFANKDSSPASISYSPSDTPATIAQSFASAIGSICTQTGQHMITDYVTAQFQPPAEIVLTDCPNSSYPDQVWVSYTYSTSPDYETNPSMLFPVNGGNPNEIGTVQLLVSGTVQGSYTYQVWDTPASIAAGLVADAESEAFRGGNSPVQLQAQGATLNITSLAAGTAANLPYQIQIADNTGTSPFSASPASGSLSGGTDSTYASGTIYSYSLGGANSYALNGNITSIGDSIQGAWNYGYDWLNRLTSAATGTAPYGTNTSNPGTIGWTYDSFGNRLTQTLTGATNLSVNQPTWSYSQNNNHIDGFCYDAAGNMLSANIYCSNDQSYDAEERVSGSGSSYYLYDAEGRRVGKWSGSALSATTLTNVYVLDVAGRDITEQDGQGNWKHTDVYGPDGMLATYDAQGVHFYLHDWLGTRRAQTNAAGEVEAVFPSLPFGDSLPTPSGFPTLAAATEKQFTGKERDSESGLDYFGARYYSSNMGRWMSPDWSAKAEPVPYAKMGNPQSLNLYTYVGNDPLGSVDSDGHDLENTMANSQAYNEAMAASAERIASMTETISQQNAAKAQQQNAGASPSSGGTSRTVTLNIGGQKVTVAYSYGNIFSNYVGGVDITATPQNCSGCAWAQVYSRGSGSNKDGDGIGPLYGDEGRGLSVFYDTPASSGPGSFTATTILGTTSISGKSFTAIGGFTYGYSVNANGGVTMMAPSVATPRQMSGAIQVLQNNSPDWTIH